MTLWVFLRLMKSNKTAGGLFLTEASKDKPSIGTNAAEKEKAGPPIPTFQRSNLITRTSSQNNRLISKPVTCSPANLTLKPLGDKVLVKIKSAEEKTVGGILLPSTARSKPQGGELVAVGEGKTLGKDKLEITVKDWSQIVYSKYAGTELRVLWINSSFIEGR
ncbi:hypothetical protein IFM89_020751 [Coptis chinensis]|uniref:20 kDa chaperonin, chloroplastic n=1 Tax=Coptis chinensis TaxID=261450 RepID=A0A835M080_9MAGN|nr:hypothetical protein IFM89_020751 [Coptis chinensis]